MKVVLMEPSINKRFPTPVQTLSGVCKTTMWKVAMHGLAMFEACILKGANQHYYITWTAVYTRVCFYPPSGHSVVPSLRLRYIMLWVGSTSHHKHEGKTFGDYRTTELQNLMTLGKWSFLWPGSLASQTIFLRVFVQLDSLSFAYYKVSTKDNSTHCILMYIT